MVVAALVPAASSAGPLAKDQPWAATATPQATLRIAGRGFASGALSSDGRMAVVAGRRAVFLFRASSEGSWRSTVQPAARLRLPRAALTNPAGLAISADGTTVLVAAGSVGNSAAAVYVFHVSSPRAWRSWVTPVAKLTNASEPSGFASGVALSSDGTTALVGELEGADVFHVPTAGSWHDSSTPTATLVADPAGEKGGLGITVALSADGTTALIGATSLQTYVGAAYVFRAAAADAWASTAAPDAVLTDGLAGLAGDGFGSAVSLSPDGTTALVGAPNLAFGPAGAAYFFRASSPRAWASTGDPNAVVDRRTSSVPGWSVSLSGDGTALVGEPSVLGTPGAADVLQVSGTDITHAKLTNAAGPPRDLFGAGVGLSSDGTTALVSSARGSFIFTRAGSRGATDCYVPYLEGEKLDAAKRIIRSTHCSVGTVTRVSTPRGHSDCVISETPESGHRLAVGARVYLRVVKG